jgi:tetratricopeptide (TPR) repeat protein
MPDNTEYIESYFQQTLSNEERKAFELRCETDAPFANEVAIYITTRQVLREALLEQKTQQWKEEVIAQEEAPVISIKRKTTFAKWTMYAAAACLLLVASVFLFERNTSPRLVASNYMENNYATLSHTMDASHDSMQLGISAYNNKDFATAIRLFEAAEKTQPSNSDAIKYAGLSYLQQKNYDKAIQQFDELANMKNLFSNSGDFLKAVALMERNKPGDKEEAKQLLHKVITENEDGSKEAAEWVRKF